MEAITISLGKDAEYDRLVHGSLKQVGTVQIVTKDKGTVQGNPVAVLAFQAQLPTGEIVDVQAVTTVRNLQLVAAATIGRYGNV